MNVPTTQLPIFLYIVHRLMGCLGWTMEPVNSSSTVGELRWDTVRSNCFVMIGLKATGQWTARSISVRQPYSTFKGKRLRYDIVILTILTSLPNSLPLMPPNGTAASRTISELIPIVPASNFSTVLQTLSILLCINIATESHSSIIS
jgi:hypothetical protein